LSAEAALKAEMMTNKDQVNGVVRITVNPGIGQS
jgi:hypothetical protein